MKIEIMSQIFYYIYYNQQTCKNITQFYVDTCKRKKYHTHLSIANVVRKYMCTKKVKQCTPLPLHPPQQIFTINRLPRKPSTISLSQTIPRHYVKWTGFLKIHQRTKDKPNHPQRLKSKTTSPPMKIMILHTPTNTTTNA